MKKEQLNLLRIKPIILFLLLVGHLGAQDLQVVAPEEVGMSAERLEQLTDRFRKYVEEDELPGSVTLVARQGKVAY